MRFDRVGVLLAYAVTNDILNLDVRHREVYRKRLMYHSCSVAQAKCTAHVTGDRMFQWWMQEIRSSVMRLENLMLKKGNAPQQQLRTQEHITQKNNIWRRFCQ